MNHKPLGLTKPIFLSGLVNTHTFTSIHTPRGCCRLRSQITKSALIPWLDEAWQAWIRDRFASPCSTNSSKFFSLSLFLSLLTFIISLFLTPQNLIFIFFWTWTNFMEIYQYAFFPSFSINKKREIGVSCRFLQTNTWFISNATSFYRERYLIHL